MEIHRKVRIRNAQPAKLQVWCLYALQWLRDSTRSNGERCLNRRRHRTSNFSFTRSQRCLSTVYRFVAEMQPVDSRETRTCPDHTRQAKLYRKLSPMDVTSGGDLHPLNPTMLGRY